MVLSVTLSLASSLRIVSTFIELPMDIIILPELQAETGNKKIN